MATSVPETASQVVCKATGAGIALSADTTRMRAVNDPAASLASEGRSHSDFLLPVFDLADYLSGRTDPDANVRQCSALAECLRGALRSGLSASLAFFEPVYLSRVVALQKILYISALERSHGMRGGP